MMKFINWLLTPPNESDMFFVNLRETVQIMRRFFVLAVFIGVAVTESGCVSLPSTANPNPPPQQEFHSTDMMIVGGQVIVFPHSED